MQLNTKPVCRGAILFSLIVAIFISACSKNTGNPLLDATEGQFLQAMSFSISDCENIFFNPSEVRHPTPNDRQNCAYKVKQNSAHAQISGVVTLAHIDDPKVRERYFALKSK